MFRVAARRCCSSRGPFDPHKILGVTPRASTDEIKKAYHRLALRFHPDGGPEGNAARFNAVNEAYHALKDGKWDSAGEKRRQQAHAAQSGAGWDESMRMYVYEKPGSTTESYVSGQTETSLRIVMIACFVFVIVRMFLWRRAPSDSPSVLMREEEGPVAPDAQSTATHTASSSASHFPAASSATEQGVSATDQQQERREEQWIAPQGLSMDVESANVHPDTAHDPLARSGTW